MWQAALDPIHTMGNSTGRTASIPQQRDFKGKNKVEGECVDYKNLSDVLKNFSWLTKLCCLSMSSWAIKLRRNAKEYLT